MRAKSHKETQVILQKTSMETTVKGYKVFKPDFKCLDYQFAENSEFKMNGSPKACERGFHFCTKLSHCFYYYEFDSNNIVCEVEALGEVVYHDEDSKAATNHIKIGRRLEWHEVLIHANDGKNNTGHSNTGDRNTGDSNTGDRNTGYRNTGDSNTGYRNTGDRNTGYRNTGYSNTGDSNTGDRNTGYRNTGDSNTGDSNTGDRNTGYRNTGDSNTGYRNTGDRNTGYRNTGDSNTGYSNTGYRNTGDSNTGYSNTGDRNTGDRNTGDRNTGKWNTGDRNTGYSNTGDRNTGAFCTGDPGFPMFNKPSNWTEQDFKNSKAYQLLCEVDTKLWIPQYEMTEEEKQANRGWKTAEGFYRDIPYKEAFQNKWNNWSESNRKAFTSLPNFDAEIFKEITGVHAEGEQIFQTRKR